VIFEVTCVDHLEPLPGDQVPTWEMMTSLRHCPLLQAPTHHPGANPGLNTALGLLWLCSALFQKQMEQVHCNEDKVPLVTAGIKIKVILPLEVPPFHLSPSPNRHLSLL